MINDLKIIHPLTGEELTKEEDAKVIKSFLEKRTYKEEGSLFVFTIGPVQSFINQARKTQDFYAGSFLLSYLTLIAIKEVIGIYGISSIIYPDVEGRTLNEDFSVPTFPNKLVAILPESSEEKIKELGELLKEKIREEVKKIAENALNRLKISLNEKQKETLSNHIKDFPQVYWGAILWDKDFRKYENITLFLPNSAKKEFKRLFEKEKNVGFDELYKFLYIALEKTLGMRKNLREFKQLVEAGRKCSVCGEKNVLFFKDNNENKFLRYNPLAYHVKDGLVLKNREGLCGLCFIKRCLKTISFPSTAEIACADFKEKVFIKAKSEFKAYEEEFLKAFNKKEVMVEPVPKLQKEGLNKTLEAYWFYSENLRQKEIEENLGISPTEEILKRLRGKLEELTKKLGTPFPYYAVIKLDGDEMGKWLSGEKVSDLTPSVHRFISRALRNYALELVFKIVEEEHLGKLVYAGGDDVLAFVNLKDLWDVMHKLRASFSGQVKIGQNGKLEVDWNNTTGFIKKNGKIIFTMGPKATASMGVVIAHYKTPLQLVLNKASIALERAKEYENDKGKKDAFCVCLMKRSGEERWTGLKWRYEDNFDTIKEIKDLAKKFKYFSPRFIYKLQEEFSKLRKDNYLSLYPQAFKTELFRLLNRAYNGKDKKEVKNFAEILFKIYENTGENFDNFVNLLHIITFLETKSAQER